MPNPNHTEQLRYALDDRPGITRRRSGRGFSYVGVDGQPIVSSSERRRLRALAIPPAWKQVWIAPERDVHLLATGRDTKGRKQYLYHPAWRETQEARKFEQLPEFARSLPRLRRQVAEDLARRRPDRQKVTALAIRLLERSLIRVGNPRYQLDNGSFGLTTLLARHARIEGGTVRLNFRGKAGIMHRPVISDARLARSLARLQDLPGQRLFSYQAEDGEVRDLDSSMVNEYVRDCTGVHATAKDFRTWAATVLAATHLASADNLKTGMQAVAKRLGNTPAIVRKSYVHPRVIEAYQLSTLSGWFGERSPASPRGLTALERRVLAHIDH